MATSTSFSPEASTKARQFERLDLECMARELRWLQNALSVASTAKPGDVAVEFCHDVVYAHNDLLSGNVLVVSNPDGSQEESVRLIDFEYGAYNYRAFDLANHFCEHAGFDFDLDRWYPSESVQLHWLHSYAEALPAENKYRPLLSACPSPTAAQRRLWHDVYIGINKFALASHYWWGLWAIVQAQHSPIDFDFMGYSLMRFEGYSKHKRLFFPDEPAVVLVRPEPTPVTETEA